MKPRLLGTLCMLGGLIGIPDGVRLAVTGQNSTQLLSNASTFLWACGALCGLWGIYKLNAAGTSLLAKIVAVLPMIGFVFIAAQEVIWLINPQIEIPFITGPLAALGMLVFGISVIVAKRWSGWRRFSPLFHLAAIVLAILANLLGLPPMIAIFISLAWVLIGYAVQSTPASEWAPTEPLTKGLQEGVQ